MAQLEQAVASALTSTNRPLDELVAHVSNSWRPPTRSAADLVVSLVQQFGDAGGVDALDDRCLTPFRPAHCGACDERTRLLDHDGDHPRRCKVCHPLTRVPVVVSA